ncbi:hypothetical protein D3C81_381350 [compost metagenome]
MHGDVSGFGVFLQALQHGQPGMIRQTHVQQDGVGNELPGQVVTFVGAVGHQAVVTQFMGEVVEDVCEVGFVFHHQNAARAKRCLGAVIVETRDIDFGDQWFQLRSDNARRGCRRQRTHRLNRAFARLYILLRQHQGKHTALPRRAGHADRAAEQRRKVTGNRQAQPRAAITAIGGAIGLAEGFENTFLLIIGNANAGIADDEGNAVVRCSGNTQADFTLLGKLHRVGQKVLDHLLQTLTISEHHRW